MNDKKYIIYIFIKFDLIIFLMISIYLQFIFFINLIINNFYFNKNIKKKVYIFWFFGILYSILRFEINYCKKNNNIFVHKYKLFYLF